VSDVLVRALWADKGLSASIAIVTDAAREGQKLHGLQDVSAMLLGQAMAAGALLVSLQKDQTRVNLQIECDGPMRGLFVDAGADGYLRGYIKNQHFNVEGNRGANRWRPAMGNAGFLSVLKDIGEGDYYRSSVELAAMDPAADLEHYFATSEQVATHVALAVERSGAEPLGVVAGVLIQAMPNADLPSLQRLGESLGPKLEQHVLAGKAVDDAALLTELLPDFSKMSSLPLVWRCSCSKERVLTALSAMGKAELEDLLAEKGGAAASCQFCGKRHEATADDLKELIART
jgi:molecular chaperone Hsp33